MAWLPIETAPKDGTTIWLVEPGSTGVFAGRWLGPCFFVEDAHDLWPSRPSHWQPYDKTNKPKHPESK